MKQITVNELRIGDIFKLENSGIDAHRIVKSVTVYKVAYSRYTLVRVYYEFMEDEYNDTVFKTNNTWNTMKKVYKVLI